MMSDVDGSRVEDGGRQRVRPRRRRWPLLLLCLLAIAAASLWMVRGALRGRYALPVTELERTLSEALGAEVEIGSARLYPAPRRAELREVTIARLAILPELRQASIDRLTVYGPLRALIGGEVERVELEGVRAELLPSCERPEGTPDLRGARPLPERLQRVELRHGLLTVGAGGARSLLRVDASLERAATGWRGEARWQSGQILLAALPELALPSVGDGCEDDATGRGGGGARWAWLDSWSPRLRAVTGTLRWRGATPIGLNALEEADLEASAGSVDWRPQVSPAASEAAGSTARVPIGSGRLSSRLVPAAVAGREDAGAAQEALRRIEGRLELPDLDELAFGASLAGAVLQQADVTLRGLRLEAWVPRLAPGVAIPVGSADGRISYRENAARVELDAHLKETPKLADWRARDADVEAVLEIDDWPAGTGSLQASARVGALSTPSSIPARAALLDGAMPLRLTVSSPVAHLQGLWRGEAMALRPKVGLVTDRLGVASAQGSLTVARAAPTDLSVRWRWQPDADAAAAALSLVRSALPATIGDRLVGLEAGLTANGTLRARGERLELGGRLDASDVTLELATAGPLGETSAWRSPVATAEARWRAADRTVKVSLSSNGELAVGSLEAERGSLAIEAAVASAGFELERATFSSARLGTLTVTASVPAQGQAGGTAALSGAAIAAWRGWLGPVLDWQGLAPSELSGTWRTDLEWTSDAGALSANGDVRLEQAGWSSADGSRVVQGLSPAAHLEARSEGRSSRVEATGRIGDFQMLWDTQFADYTDRTMDFVGNAEWRSGSSPPGPDQALTVGLSLDGDHGARLSLDARRDGAESGTWQYRASARVPDVGATVREYVSEPFGFEQTDLAGLEVGGAVEASFDGEWAPLARSVHGAVSVHDGALRWNDRVTLEGLEVEMPADATWRPGGDPSGARITGEPRHGRVAWRSLQVGGVAVPALAAPLRVEGTDLTLEGTLRVPVFGGEVALDRAALRDPFELAGERSLDAALSFRGIDLERMTGELDLPLLHGQVNGELPRVVLAGDELHAAGAGQIEIFGGHAVVDQVSVTDIGQPFPHLRFSTRFSDVDLAQLTETLEFGHITGRLEGELLDVELVGGVPIHLHGKVETVETKGVKQRVSIAAVNNLTLLGTGRDASFLQKGLRSLFDSYPYQAIGIAVTLEQDDFLLYGLERRGDKQLFLKGRWPLRLDIVNARPGHRVSFKAMVSRIGNLKIVRGPGGQEEPAPRPGDPR